MFDVPPTGSSIRDESLHSTLTQKQSIDSMTLSSRGHSFKIQSSNQFKLKSNFKSKSQSIIQCQQSIELPVEHSEKSTNKSSIYKNRSSVKKEPNLYGPEINSDTSFHTKGTMSTGEHLQSTEMLSMAPNIESDSKKIRLTITPMHVQSRRSKQNVLCYNKPRRSTGQPQTLRSLFGWYRPKKNAAFYSPPLEHPIKGIKINIHTNDNPNRIRTAAVNVDSMSSNEDEEISNSSLKNVDRAALKDELAAYMDEIRAREKR